jgi:MFS family permease
MGIVISMTAYISKRTPKNIRGMIYAVVGSMCGIGSIVYLQLYNALINTLGYASLSFSTIAFLDFVILIFLLIMIKMNKFGMVAAGTVDEDTEAVELRGPDAGKGGYADIPQLEGLPDRTDIGIEI